MVDPFSMTLDRRLRTPTHSCCTLPARVGNSICATSRLPPDPTPTGRGGRSNRVFGFSSAAIRLGF